MNEEDTRKIVVNAAYNRHIAPLGAIGLIRFYLATQIGTLAYWIGGHPYAMFVVEIIAAGADFERRESEAAEDTSESAGIDG